MLRVLVALAALAATAAPAAAQTTETRIAAWRLTGIAKDQRTLHLVYEGGGCWREDGRAAVDESDPRRVTITVRETLVTGVPCTTDLGFIGLDVRLGAPLAGRRVRGGPGFDVPRPQEMPRVAGLRRADAITALEAQGIKARVLGRGAGVIAAQSPRPGSPIPVRGATLKTDEYGRLRVAVPKGQTLGSVLRRGLRVRYRVDPAVEKRVGAGLVCGGEDLGEVVRWARRGRGALTVGPARRVRRALRARDRAPCHLVVSSFPSAPGGLDDALETRFVELTLRRR